MKLRSRIVLTLLAISVLLVGPAMYALFALRELQQVAQNLRTRDAVSSLALGRLQAALGQLEYSQRVYLALAQGRPAERREPRQQVEASIADVEAELQRLARGYSQVTAPAAAQWQQLKEVVALEQELVEDGNISAADSYRVGVVNPAFVRMDSTLSPIGVAINEAGEAQVHRAQEVAARAATTVLIALAVALALAIGIGGWLTRSLLRPVHELRRGMAVVAAGDFDPEVDIPPDRPDELGDLARSFQRMTAQLAELDRIKAEFVSIASHELKTPLSVIRGYVSLLQDGIYGPVPEQQHKILASVSDQTDRLARLIQQLLDVSRLEAGGGRLDLQPLNLHEFLADLATSFEVLAFQNEIDFKFEIADGLPHTLVGDADRLNEVIGNLLSNAFKFTPRHGRIRLQAAPRDSMVVIEVSDTGVGIPEAHLPRIFEKFYQVENEAQPRSVGSGLGLAIAREIVEAHGGTIAAESTVGRGTTFRVSLPNPSPAPDGGAVIPAKPI
jgi:signal transduction histidine kinase